MFGSWAVIVLLFGTALIALLLFAFGKRWTGVTLIEQEAGEAMPLVH